MVRACSCRGARHNVHSDRRKGEYYFRPPFYKLAATATYVLPVAPRRPLAVQSHVSSLPS